MARNCVSGLCLIAALAIPGCGAEDKNDVSKERLKQMAGVDSLAPTTVVSGAVTVDGSPAKGVYLYLHSTDGSRQVSECRTDAEGKYTWSTHLPGDGLKAGDYIVTFKYIPKANKKDVGEDKFKGKYSNPRKSEFKLSVKDGSPQTDVNYELKTK